MATLLAVSFPINRWSPEAAIAWMEDNGLPSDSPIGGKAITFELASPTDFDSFRVGRFISRPIIMRVSNKGIINSISFPITKWTKSEAAKWLRNRDLKVGSMSEVTKGRTKLIAFKQNTSTGGKEIQLDRAPVTFVFGFNLKGKTKYKAIKQELPRLLRGSTTEEIEAASSYGALVKL